MIEENKRQADEKSKLNHACVRRWKKGEERPGAGKATP